MGWVMLAVMCIGAFTALRLFTVPKTLAIWTAAALLLGAGGYALQGRAGLAGHPVGAAARAVEVDPGMAAFRTMILPASPEDAATLAAADEHMRAGETQAAVDLLLRAIAGRPRDPALWTGLGNALAAHQDGALSPAALFAFRHAWQLAPRDPGPPFFLGLAFIRSGELPRAKTAWLRALALTPRDAPWRIDIAERLALLDEFQAMANGARR